MSIVPPDNSIMYRALEGYRRSMALYDHMLSLVTVPYETCYVETRFGTTHVLRAGPRQASPVFLLHGMNANAVTWLPQINALAQRYCVYAADMPGGMGKSAPTRIPRTGSGYADWLTDVMDGLTVDKGSFIGVSFGSWLALKLATVASPRMISAILLSSAGFVPQSNRPLLKMLPRFLLMPFVPMERRARMFLEVMGAPGYQPTPEDIEMFGLFLTYVKYDQRAPDPQTDEELACLTCPTALFYGEHEAAFDKEPAIQRARKMLPNLVRVEVVPGVGHGMTGEDIPRVNALLLAFLQEYHVKNS